MFKFETSESPPKRNHFPRVQPFLGMRSARRRCQTPAGGDPAGTDVFPEVSGRSASAENRPWGGAVLGIVLPNVAGLNSASSLGARKLRLVGRLVCLRMCVSVYRVLLFA